MAKTGFTSAPGLEVKVPAVRNVLASSPAHRETRSAAKKRNADQVAESEGEDANRGSLDSTQRETPADAEKKPPAQNTKARKKARNSVSANSNASQKKDLQERIKDLQDRNKKIEAEKKTLQSKLTKLEASLKNVTKQSVLNARKGAKGVWDQRKIDTEFKSLKRDIKNWVKKYGTAKKILTFSDGDKKDILSACDLDQYRVVFSKDDFDTIQELPKGAQLLLEGFLYAYSIYHLVNRPFLFVDAVLQVHCRPNGGILAFGNYENVFEKFADTLAECEDFPDQGQRWVASMLQCLKRMIIPDPLDDIASHLRDEKLSSDSYRIYELGISQLASRFLYYGETAKAAKHLLDDVEKKENKPRLEELKKIHRKFRELAYHMWCQPSTVSYYYGMDQFDPDFMELDVTAVHGGEDMDRMKDSKVLIRLCPLIRGDIIDPVNGKEPRKIDYLTQRVWTVDCQTRGQWKASQVQESKDTDCTMSNPPSADSDGGPDLQPSTDDAEIAHSMGSPDANDAANHDDLDEMEEH